MTEPLDFGTTAEKQVMLDAAQFLLRETNGRTDPKLWEECYSTVMEIINSFPKVTTITRSVWGGHETYYYGTVDLVCHKDGSVTWENWVDECD